MNLFFASCGKSSWLAGGSWMGESDVKEAGKLERAFVRWAHLEWVGLPLGRAGRRRRGAGPAGSDGP